MNTYDEIIVFIRSYRYHQEDKELSWKKSGNVIKAKYEVQDRKDGTVGLWLIVNKALKHYFVITRKEFERLKNLNTRDSNYIS